MPECCDRWPGAQCAGRNAWSWMRAGLTAIICDLLGASRPHPIWRQHPVHSGAIGNTYRGAPEVRLSHAPCRGFCGAVAVPASSIPALAGWGTPRLQLRRSAPERYDPRFSRPGGWGPLGAPCRPWPFSEAHSWPLLPFSQAPSCSQAHNPDGQDGHFHFAS